MESDEKKTTEQMLEGVQEILKGNLSPDSKLEAIRELLGPSLADIKRLYREIADIEVAVTDVTDAPDCKQHGKCIYFSLWSRSDRCVLCPEKKK